MSLIFFSLLFAMTDIATGSSVSGMGRVTGKIECGNKDLTFGFLMVFPSTGLVPDPSKFWTTASETIFPLDADGKFDVRLREGSYYILAVKRHRQNVSDLEPGDCFFLNSLDNVPAAIKVGKDTRLDLGTKKGVSYTLQPEGDKGRTVIRGVITDGNNRPATDVLVAAYSKKGYINVPDFVSVASGKDGRYELRLPGGGSYFLTAVSRLGGLPSYGDYFGEPEANPFTIKSGESREVNIRVRRMP